MSAGRVLAFLVFALLAACATPVGTDYTAMSVSLPPLKPGEGRVFFYTPRVRFGGDVQPELRLNGTVVGFAVPSGFFYVDRPPGRYEATGKTAADGRLELPARGGRNEVRARVRPVGLLGQRGPLPAGARDRGPSGHGRLVYSGIAAP